MEKEFLPYTESLELKEIGFNEPCFKVGNPNGVICWRFMDVVGMEGVGIDNLLEVEFDNRWVEIPTFSQAFSWFREKHKLYHCIQYSGKDYVAYTHNVNGMTKYSFDTYEEAELEGLKKLIEIVKQKA